ncbi:MAG: hypothetical protein PUA84_03840, partial [Oscillospiraceae bacterium]|nr:hypothetical protein [Oscillospiraceae bacterium]
MREDYLSIISRPHHVSAKRYPMSMSDRAAQFAPFAALTGYEDEVDEVARLTDSLKDMTEDDQDELNKAFCRLMESESERPPVTVSYFKPDSKKSGGKYLTYTGNFRFYDEAERKLKFTDGMIIDMEY